MSTHLDFKNENTLALLFKKVVTKSIPNKNGIDHPIIISEFSAKRGRVDIICAVLESEIEDVDKVMTIAKSLSEINKARIISLLRKSIGYSEEYLRESLGLSKSTIRKHVRDLLEEGIIEKTQGNLLTLGKWINIPKLEIWAFELKLNNWKRAFYQAQRYRGFSHNVVVVMPNGRLNGAMNNLNYFIRMNVGLASLKKNGELEFVLKPKRKRPSSKGHYLYSLGKILTEYIESNSNAVPKARKGRPKIP